MLSLRIVSCALPGLLFPFAALLSAGEGAPEESRPGLSGLPRVPAQALILKDARGDESATVRQWAQALIEVKEKRALVELADIKKQVRQEEEVRVREEDEARRRQDRLNQSWGALGTGGAVLARRGALRVRLDFMVPEIGTYRLAVEAARVRQALANDIAAALARVDRNSDGKLTGEEYVDAAALAFAAARLLVKLDAAGSGYLAPEELEVIRNLPENSAVALRAGRPAAEARDYRLKPFDKDGNGVLDMDERKALTMAFVDASLRAAQDAAFYTLVADSLAVARDAAALKYASVEVTP